jgi:hydroxymethylglutaryl-CoA synthase
VCEIAQAHGKHPEKIIHSTGVSEKSVPGYDEDTITLAVRASGHALARASINGQALGALYIGSESHPYAVKPSAATIGAVLQTSPWLMASDLEFACKAGTAALQMGMGVVGAGIVKHALAIGSDTAQASPGDILEYTAGAGSAAFVLTSDESLWCAVIEKTLSLTTDTPDFWRRSLQKYPQHTGRFTAQPAYFDHVIKTAQKIMHECAMGPQDFNYVIFHQPNGQFPAHCARALGFTQEQLAPGLLVNSIGNAYSASSLLGLVSVLEQARAGQKILLVSYGSGSGCDAFVLTTTERLEKTQSCVTTVRDYCNNKNYISYITYKKYSAGIYGEE